MTAAYMITTSGGFGRVNVGDDDAFLSSLYHLIGCDTVDVVGLTDRLTMWVDDEAVLTGQPANRLATHVGEFLSGRPFGQYIHGHAVFLAEDRSGEPTSLSDAEIESVREAIEEAEQWRL